jgi:hypothetical protein
MTIAIPIFLAMSIVSSMGKLHEPVSLLLDSIRREQSSRFKVEGLPSVASRETTHGIRVDLRPAIHYPFRWEIERFS